MVIQNHTTKISKNHWILIPADITRSEELQGLLQVITLKKSRTLTM
jgi:hypothetical protein